MHGMEWIYEINERFDFVLIYILIYIFVLIYILIYIFNYSMEHKMPEPYKYGPGTILGHIGTILVWPRQY